MDALRVVMLAMTRPFPIIRLVGPPAAPAGSVARPPNDPAVTPIRSVTAAALAMRRADRIAADDPPSA